jgi:CIC family chloride channel protein
MITAHAVADTLADEPTTTKTVADVLTTVPTVGAGDTLDTALDRLDESLAPALAVVDPNTGDIVGWLTHESILFALRGKAIPARAG